jgi:hypothetical protein
VDALGDLQGLQSTDLYGVDVGLVAIATLHLDAG